MPLLNQNYTPRNLKDIDNLNVKSDIAHPYFIKRENLSILYKLYEPKDGDFYVATYPKSGTTWTIKIVENVLGNVLDGIGGGIAESECLPWLETTTVPHMRQGTQEEAVARANSKKDRRWKTHSCVGLLPRPTEGKIKVIVTTRHPLDVFVSAWHHARRDPDFKFDGSFRTFYREACLTGDYISGHILQYHEEYFLAAKNGDIDCLFLRYEDMKSPVGAIEGVHKIAKFLGVDNYDAEEIAEKTSFASMKNLSKKGFIIPIPDQDSGEIKNTLLQKPMDHDDKGSSEKHSNCHIRKGEAGGWVDYLNKEDLEIWRDYVKVHARANPNAVEFFGLDFLLASHIEK